MLRNKTLAKDRIGSRHGSETCLSLITEKRFGFEGSECQFCIGGIVTL